MAVTQAEPEVDWIILTKSKDTKRIESLLDRLMDYSDPDKDEAWLANEKERIDEWKREYH